jgi:hypothetical protein
VPALIVFAPPPTDEELTFRTYRGYLQAMRMGIGLLCPHDDGLLPGVAAAVSGGGWQARTPIGRTFPERAGQYLRNAWATEVLLNAPRAVGGAELITFANHWAVVQAYYAVFEALNAVVLTGGSANPPATHASMLRWAAYQLGTAASPFPEPWTCRVTGAPGYRFEGFPSGWTRSPVSNIANVSTFDCFDRIAQALKTTRDHQIEEKRSSWIRELRTRRGTPRRTLPRAVLEARATAMAPTTLFDLLYRLLIRSNYQEADAFLRGALSSADAESFHRALCDIVAATLLVIEIQLAHQVGAAALGNELDRVRVPNIFAESSAEARRPLWSVPRASPASGAP